MAAQTEFTIPNKDVAFAAVPQSEVFEATLKGLTRAIGGTGVVSGCAVDVVSGLTVSVSAGTVRTLGLTKSISAGNLTASAAHATLYRIDLVVIDSAGSKAIRAGTAAAATAAKEPDLSTGDVLLAQLYVPPTLATFVAANHITGRQAFVTTDGAILIGSPAYPATSTGINAALTACVSPGGGHVIIPANMSITLSAGIVIPGDNTTLEFKGGAKLNLPAGAVDIIGITIAGAGAASSIVNCPSTMLRYANSILVDSAVLFAVGDNVLIANTSTGNVQYDKIAEISGTTIKFENVAAWQQDVNLSYLLKLDTRKNCRIINPWIVGTGNTGQSYGIAFNYTDGTVIDNMYAEDCKVAAIAGYGNLYARVSGRSKRCGGGSGFYSAMDFQHCFRTELNLVCENATIFGILLANGTYFNTTLKSYHSGARNVKLINVGPSHFKELVGNNSTGPDGGTGVVFTGVTYDVDVDYVEAINNWDSGISSPDATVDPSPAKNIRILSGKAFGNGDGGGDSADITLEGINTTGWEFNNIVCTTFTSGAPKTQWGNKRTINVAHDNGNYSVVGTGSWAVTSGNQLAYSYNLQNNLMTLNIAVIGTAGANTSILAFAIPNGWTANELRVAPCIVTEGSTPKVGAIARVLPETTVVQVLRDTNVGNFTAGAVIVEFTLQFNVH